MNIEKIYQLQDSIIDKIAQLDDNILFSGSTLLSRGYLSHRETDDLEFFLPEEADIEDFFEKIKTEFRGLYIVKDVNKENLYPDTLRITSAVSEITDIKGVNSVSIKLYQDLFFEDFDNFKLENGLLVSDIEGIFFRKILELINFPKNPLTVVDIAYIDNELHLIDFVDAMKEKLESKGYSFDNQLLMEKLNVSKDYVINNIEKAENTLKKYGVNIKGNVLIKWIEAKIQELQD
jgi:hypothetical protein